MNKLKKYDIFFRELSLAKHVFDFEITQDFFDLFIVDQEFEQPYLSAQIQLEKNSNFLLLNFKQKGTLMLTCDYSLEKFEYFLNAQEKLLVNFGEFFDDQGDQVLVLPYGESKINVASYIYNLFMLSLPKKRIHPKLQNGGSDFEVLKILAHHNVKKLPL